MNLLHTRYKMKNWKDLIKIECGLYKSYFILVHKVNDHIHYLWFMYITLLAVYFSIKLALSPYYNDQKEYYYATA